MVVNLMLALLFHMSRGAVGRKDAWMGIYEKLGDVSTELPVPLQKGSPVEDVA